MRICVYCSASDRVDEVYKKDIFELGKMIAERGHSVVYGGGANGLMGAIARGARSADGKVVGIIPTFFEDGQIEETFMDCTSLIKTRTMHDRKELLEENSDAFIIAPGGIGTFDEFFSVLTNKQLGRHNKAIVIYNLENYYDELIKMLECSTSKKFVNENVAKIYTIQSTKQDVLDYIENNPLTPYYDDLKNG